MKKTESYWEEYDEAEWEKYEQDDEEVDKALSEMAEKDDAEWNKNIREAKEALMEKRRKEKLWDVSGDDLSLDINMW